MNDTEPNFDNYIGELHRREYGVPCTNAQPPAAQSKGMSAVESVAGTALGFGIALASQHYIYPLFGIRISFGTNVILTCVFTVISVVRSYWVRRAFNWLHASKG